MLNNDGETNRNLILAIVLFFVFIFGYQYFFERQQSSGEPVQQTERQEQQPKLEEAGAASSEPTVTVAEALAKETRVYIENEKVKVSIDLQGGVIDTVILKEHKKTADKGSENVNILCPRMTENEFYHTVSYSAKDNDLNIGKETLWEVVSNAGGAITMKTQSANDDVVVERKVSIDDGYMIEIKDSFINNSDRSLKLINSSDLIRKNPLINDYAVVHEGLVGINCNTDCKVKNIAYKKIESAKVEAGQSKWFGFTDIYWLISFVNTDNSFISYSMPSDNTYKISLRAKTALDIGSSSSLEVRYCLFAGPKDLSVLNKYKTSCEIDRFDMSIDFGWFFMLTKPLLSVLDVMAKIFNNMGVIILLLTLVFKFATYPLTKKSLYSAARMKEVQPKIAIIQKNYANDKERLNKELMALYKKEQISPMSGCLPMLLQVPIFFCLYKVFFISIEMRHAPLFWWIKDLSSPDPVFITNLFGLIKWTPPGWLQIGIWPIIMGLSMFIQQKLSTAKSKTGAPKAQEAKFQENMMYIFPIMLTYMFKNFPVGIVVYWTISNVISMIQQWYVNKSIKKKA
ncbi:MAG: membrane protein insertase YidC [Holosporales bacterium]|jgi:YidC/Oxa1 family membrane protein insertase|nr:membrane protein insertase YidC [Holosporales bacterium]